MPTTLMPYVPAPLADIAGTGTPSPRSVAFKGISALPRTAAAPSSSFFLLPTEMLLGLLPGALNGITAALVKISGLSAPVVNGSFTHTFTLADQAYVKSLIPAALGPDMSFPPAFSWTHINWSTSAIPGLLLSACRDNTLTFNQGATEASGNTDLDSMVVHWNYGEFFVDDHQTTTPPSGPVTTSELKVFYDQGYEFGAIELSASGLTLWVEAVRENSSAVWPPEYTTGAWLRVITVSSASASYFDIYSDAGGGAMRSGTCTMDTQVPYKIASKTETGVDAFDSTGAWSDPTLAQNATYVSKAGSPTPVYGTLEFGSRQIVKGGTLF